MKRKYQQRVIDVEIVYPPDFWTNRGDGEKYKLDLSSLGDKLSQKNGESYSSAISWLRTRKSFEILRSVHTCSRV